MAEQITSGNFTFTKAAIEGVVVVDVKSYGDERGYFMETYKREDFVAGGIDCEFVQDNQSASSKGVLRGLHFQIEHPQSKLVRVVEGAVFCYKCDDVYHPGDEGGLMWNDPAIGVVWPAMEGDEAFDETKIILSDKDRVHPPLASLRRA